MPKAVVSPILLLANGIKAGDWRQVCQAYEGLTGTALSPPVVVEFNGSFDTLKKLGSHVQELRRLTNDLIQAAAVDMENRASDDEPEENEEEHETPPVRKKTAAKKTPAVKQTSTKKGTTKPPPVSAPVPPRKRVTTFLPEGHQNTFVDDGKIEPKLIKETRAQVKKSAGVDKERRPGVNYVTVKCSRCSSEDRVPDSYAHLNSGKDFGGYVCNSCTPQGGGR